MKCNNNEQRSIDGIPTMRKYEQLPKGVTGEDVENKKPAPDIFLLAAQRLQLNPEHCLVIEDSVVGVEAAKAAGSRCLAVTTSFTRDLLKKADYFASDLSNVPKEALEW